MLFWIAKTCFLTCFRPLKFCLGSALRTDMFYDPRAEYREEYSRYLWEYSREDDGRT